MFNYPLTIVSATMGYGKTTTLRTYLGNKDVYTVWIPLLGSDGDEIIFWHKMCIAISRYNPDISKRLVNLGFPMDARQMSIVIDFLWEVKGDRTIVFVFDDYHLINKSKQLGMLIELITEEELPNLHIVLLSRTRPKLNHMNLIVKGLCYYLDADTLSFTVQEIKDYLILMGFHALPEDIEKIYNYTNGWISAVYLLLLGLQQEIPVTEISSITQLVDENLYSTFDDNVKNILLQLSVLGNFTLQQAVQVLQNPQVPQVIEYLLEHNAFLEHDRQTGIYKIHTVLLDYLREKLKVSDIDIKTICHQAGRWYFVHGEIDFAFDFYHRAGQIEELLDQINRVCNIAVGYLGVKLQYKIYKELPWQWYVKYPMPLLHFAGSFFLSGDNGLLQESHHIVSVLEEYYTETDDLSPIIRNRILGEVEIIKSLLVFNEVERMLEYAKKATKLYDDGISHIIFRSNEFTFGVPHLLYIYYRDAGMLKESVELFREGYSPITFDGCGYGFDYLILDEYSLEIADLQNAEFFAKKAIYKAKTKEQTCIILCANFTLMRLNLIRGETEKVKELLASTRALLVNHHKEFSQQNNVIYNSTIDLCEGYVYGCINEVGLIPEWLRTGDTSSRILMLRAVSFPNIIYGKTVMLSKNWVKLEILCESFKEEFLVNHIQLGLLHNAIYEAVAKQNLYGMESGIAILLPALCEAQLDGILLPFVENADFILDMLYSIIPRNELDTNYLSRLIQLCEEYSVNLEKTKRVPIYLTEREKQVLSMLAQGLTQREIANRLFLSVSSIKKHLESIYPKLGVNNKISAVKKAQDEKIL